ncbi:MAG: hypothetical protein ACPG66_09845, partial [Flavobacteriales bacterium]
KSCLQYLKGCNPEQEVSSCKHLFTPTTARLVLDKCEDMARVLCEYGEWIDAEEENLENDVNAPNIDNVPTNVLQIHDLIDDYWGASIANIANIDNESTNILPNINDMPTNVPKVHDPIDANIANIATTDNVTNVDINEKRSGSRKRKAQGMMMCWVCHDMMMQHHHPWGQAALPTCTWCEDQKKKRVRHSESLENSLPSNDAQDGPKSLGPNHCALPASTSWVFYKPKIVNGEVFHHPNWPDTTDIDGEEVDFEDTDDDHSPNWDITVQEAIQKTAVEKPVQAPRKHITVKKKRRVRIPRITKKNMEQKKRKKIVNPVAPPNSSTLKRELCKFMKHYHWTSGNTAMKRGLIDNFNKQLAHKFGKGCDLELALVLKEEMKQK